MAQNLTRAQRLDELPYTRNHNKLLFGSGIGWALDAMDIGLISFIMAALAAEWGLGSGELSLLGSIGFVGLVAPHLVRPFLGYDPARTLVPAGLAGAALLLAADGAVRLIPSGAEVKVGVLTALLGVPFFLWVIARRKAELVEAPA